MARDTHKQVSIPVELFEQIQWVQGFLPWTGKSPSAYARTAAEAQVRSDTRLIMEQLQLASGKDEVTAETLDEVMRRLRRIMEESKN